MTRPTARRHALSAETVRASGHAIERSSISARHRLVRVGAGVALLTLLAVAGCGVSDSSDGGTASTIQDGLGSAAVDLSAAPRGGSAGSGGVGVPNGPGAGLEIGPASLERAQIKKAQIALRSDSVGGVVTAVESLAAAQGGFVDSENTSTNAQGVAQSSVMSMRVPVDAFSATVDQVSRLGRLETKRTTTVDVSAQVADVASRVSSAKDSIAQLRTLFSRATRLGDIITLESELSARESDLEALEAQQRVLAAQTSLSTIAVTVLREKTAPPKPLDAGDHAGFVGGLRQGWDALVTAFESAAHALGAALPIGLTLGGIGLLLRAAARRLPRRSASTHGSPRPAD